MNRFDVYQFENFRTLLQNFLVYLDSKHSKLSRRGLAQKAGFKSPNYLQKVIAGERNLTEQSAENLAKACGFSHYERQYFCKLVELSRTESVQRKTEILDELKRLICKKDRRSLQDEDIYSFWANLLIIELAQLKDFELSIDNLHQRLRGHASKAEIETALNFLIAKKVLLPTKNPHRYDTQQVDFQAINDGRRRLSVQQSHLRFLEMAKHRVAAPMEDRSFQALTVAIPSAKFESVRLHIAKFLDELNEELSGDGSSDCVAQIQIQAFKI